MVQVIWRKNLNNRGTYAHSLYSCEMRNIVSNDSHFRVLNEIDWPKLQLVTIQEYVKEIENNV